MNTIRPAIRSVTATLFLMLVPLVLLVPIDTATSQSSFTIPVVLTGSSGRSDTIWLGGDPSATACTDPALGEVDIPPDSLVGTFDLRFVDPGTGAVCRLGLLRDIREIPQAGDSVAWKLSFTSDYSLYPLTISWGDLSPLLDHHQVRFQLGNFIDADLQSTQPLTLVSPPWVGTEVWIKILPKIEAPPQFVVWGPAVNMTHASAMTSALVNGYGVPTDFWIEWGSSTALGESTLSIALPVSNDNQWIYDEILGLLPDSLYYFRHLARNQFGTSVTPIDTFRTLNVDTSGGRGTIFSLKASNALGWSRVWMGYHEAATYCMDVNLGEDLLPPLPPSAVWDLRLVDPRGFDAACFDQGTYRDYRPPGNTDQTDTFLVKIQAGKGGYPVSLQWPNLSALIEGDAWLRDAFGGVLLNVNMKESTSVTLHHDALNSLMIFLSSPSETPLPVAGLDSVAFYQGTSAVAAGYVNPNGFATEAWFEYGTSDQFGSTTDTMSISGLLPIANLLGIATGMEPGSAYHFRVVARNANGTYYGPDVILAGGLSDVENPPQVPSEFLLSQNYPNPFNPTTSIRYSIPEAAEVSLVVYDLHGREVEILVDGFQPAGVHEVVWHGSGSVSSGVYYYRLTAGSSSQTRKLLYIR